jgi:HSP20 family molecular chaperone IbpA
MTRYTLFDNPLFLGFDQWERMLDRVAKSANTGYPPYNIEQIDELGLRISLAVAGFTMDDLSVAMEDRHLVIRGKQSEHDDARLFIHRGIAQRQFQRVFMLGDEIEVHGAHLDNGLLHIDLKRIVPDKKIQPIQITTPQSRAQQPLPAQLPKPLPPAKTQDMAIDAPPQDVREV